MTTAIKMATTSEAQPHVAVFAFPCSSHSSALFCLARRLAEWAPDVAFSFFATSKANAFLSSWPALPNFKNYDVNNSLSEGEVSQGTSEEEIELFLGETPGNMREALAGQQIRVTCVLSDALLWNAGLIAEEMGVPWIAFWNGSACSLTAHLSTDLIRTTIGSQSDEVAARLDEPLDFIPGFAQFCVRDLPEGIVLDSVLFNLVHRMSQEMPRATYVLINTVEEIDNAPVLQHLNATLSKYLPVGPLTLLTAPTSVSDSDPHNCLAWLESQAQAQGPGSVVYVALGTVVMLSESELAGLAEGLEASGAHFLWSLKQRMIQSLPHGFVERTRRKGLVVPWTPQMRVLGHVAVGAFLSHCGWNSMLESTAAGVPMMYRPFGADNPLNTKLATNELGIGVRVKGGVLTRDGVMEGLDVILRQEEGKKMRERIASIKLLAKNAVSESGSSIQNLKSALEIVKGS